MQAVITEIAAKHGLNLAASSTHLRLEMEGYQPLVIEKIGRHLVSVAHYAYENGDAMSDPDVVFFTGRGDWIATEISQILGYRRAVVLTDDMTEIDGVNPAKQADIAEFAEMWAENIRSQGWLEHGISEA
jgi:hypothetical protein